MKASILQAFRVCLALAIASPAVAQEAPQAPASAQETMQAPVADAKPVLTRKTSQKTGSCSAGAVRAAAAKQVAPRLTGCRYDAVAVPLVRYFSIFPALTKDDSRAVMGTILSQAPAAGEPLAPGGQLALHVAAGRPGQSGEAASSAISEASSPQPETPISTSQATSAPIGAVPAPVSPPIEPVSAEAPALFDAAVSVAAPASPARPIWQRLFRANRLWLWLALAVVGGAVIMVFRAKKPRDEFDYQHVPQVTAHLEFGPGQLHVAGPLVESRETSE